MLFLTDNTFRRRNMTQRAPVECRRAMHGSVTPNAQARAERFSKSPTSTLTTLVLHIVEKNATADKHSVAFFGGASDAPLGAAFFAPLSAPREHPRVTSYDSLRHVRRFSWTRSAQ